MRKIYFAFFLSAICTALHAQDPCPSNHALDFDGVNDYIQLNNSTLTGNSNFTVEVRFFRDPAAPGASNQRRLFSLGGLLITPPFNIVTTRFDVFEISGQLYFQWNADPAYTVANNINDGNWHHLAAVRNGNNFKIYLDGNLIKDQNVSTALNITAFRLGTSWVSPGTGFYWDGKLDEVRIWNTARTEAQIDPYINCSLASCNQTNLRAYYKFNQGIANGNNPGTTTLTDCTANNLNGALTGPFALTGSSSNWVCGDPQFGAVCCPADFSWTSDSCGNVQFTNLTQQPVPPPYTYAWDFNNDGTTDSNTANPSWDFSTPGNYTVCLSLITGAGDIFCKTCKTVTVTDISGPPVIVSCSPNVTLNCGDPYQVPVPAVQNNPCADQLNITGSRSDLLFMNDPFPVGVTVITWTATNEFGSNTCTNTVTVTDNVPPVALCNNITFVLNGSTITVTPQMVNNGSFDACCPNVTLSFPNAPAGLIFNCQDACPPIPQTVVLMVSDCNGNTSTCTAQLAVVDNTPPIVSCHDQLIIQVDAFGFASISVNDVIEGVAFDNCGITDMFLNTNGFDCSVACGPPQTVVLTAVDCAGNTAQCWTSVEVEDKIPPQIVCPPNQTVSTDPGICQATVSAAPASLTDNCTVAFLQHTLSGATTGSAPGPVQNTLFNTGVTTCNYIAQDDCGNTATCSFTVTVLDFESPVIINCPQNISVSALPGQSGAAVSWISPSASDNCPGVTLTSTHTSGDIFPCGVTVVAYIVEDASGNTATCTFSVTVDCPPPPSCECGGFSNLTFGPQGTAPQNVACGQFINVPCPVDGTTFVLNGNFTCVGPNCLPSNIQLVNSDNTPIGSGSITGTSFSWSFGGYQISNPGWYELYLRGDCGQQTCECIVRFVVPECPDTTCENRALDFDGIDDMVTVNPSPVLGDDDFTVEALFTSTANGGTTTCSGDFRRLFSFGGTNSRFEVGECAGLMSIYWYNGISNGPYNMSDQNIRDSNCHHIAVIRYDDSVRVLLDGTLIFLSGGVSPLNTSFFRLGQWVGSLAPGENWQGLIDEVRVWNYRRSETDILANNGCELLGSETGLVGYWPLNQGIAEGNNSTVTQCTDMAGNDHPGVMSNFTLNGKTSNWVCGCELCKPSRDTLACGDAVVTCYSGLPGASGVVAAIKKLQNVYSLPTGTDLSGSISTSKMWLKTELGEVFGIAIDNNNQGDIYFTSTTVYGPTAPGPNGYGGIYKVDGNTLLVDPGWGISLPNLPGSAVTSATTSLIHSPGLGNICYDKWNNQLLVTNFEDGRIYRIDPTGTGSVIDYFDPYGDNGLPGFAPIGERPWGIDVTQNAAGEIEVYYAVWAVDKLRYGGGAYNSIRRVKLNPGGSFDTGSDVEVIQLPYTIAANYSNPVSDIAISQDGETMLLAERTMDGDMKPDNAITAVWAHQSRLLRYERTGSTWTYDQTIPIGEYGSGTFGRNSAGGVDFGNYISANDSVTTCDTSIWCTGDYLRISWPNKVYGMQGFYHDNPAVTNVNSWLLDFDGLLAQYDKSLLGDVEIFKCVDCPIVNPCESISAVAVPDSTKTGCCYTLHTGNQTPDFFTYVNISVIDGGSLVTSPPPAAGAGWTLQGYSGNSALFQPTGGTIPTGLQQVADFCLENLTADEQTIVIEFYDQSDSVVCRDTLKLKCDACVQTFVDSVYCESWNVYKMDFCVKAGEDLDWTIGSISIHPPAGITFTPDVFSLPDLTAGQTYCYLTTTVTGGTPGQVICFSSVVHHEDIAAGELDLSCCADTVPVCFTLPDCDPCDPTVTYATTEPASVPGDSCCWKITLHNPPGYYTGVSTEIITPGVVFGAVSNFPPVTGWQIAGSTSSYLSWDPFGIQGTHVQDGWMLPVMCFDGTAPGPWELAITWYAEDSTECYDTLAFNCTPPAGSDCVLLDTFDLECLDDGVYTFNFTITNVTDNPAITADHIVLGQLKPAPPPYDVFDPQVHWQTIPPNTPVSFSSQLHGNPGDTICFTIALHDVNDDSLHLNCCADTFCIVLPPCGQTLECAENIVIDGGFLNTYHPQFQNLTDFWVAYDLSTPNYITDDSCNNNNSAEMMGTQLSGEGIYQKVNFIAGHLYAIRLCARYADPFGGLQPQIRLFADDGIGTSTYPASGCTLPDCELIGFTPVLGTNWAFYTLNWVADNDYTRLILTPWNQSVIPGQEVPSVVRVDRICVDDHGVVLPSYSGLSVRAYPNPTSGNLTLELDRVLGASATLRVFDAFGRLVKTERVAEAQLQHELSLDGLPAGVYFVEIGDSEARLWGQRIVKE